MIQITIPETEMFDEETETFLTIPEKKLTLEHSLLSISKWESKWHVPFIISNKNDPPHTNEQMIDYIRCMTIEKNVDQNVYLALTAENMLEINEYISNSMTATTVKEGPSSPFRREVITSELIYYWMVVFNIPIECEKWHINRLIMLIKVCAAKNNPKKMSNRAILSQNHRLNEARKKALGTRG